MGSRFKALLCKVQGCQYRYVVEFEGRAWRKRRSRRRWIHSHTELRARCFRCGGWSGWYRKNRFWDWLDRQGG